MFSRMIKLIILKQFVHWYEYSCIHLRHENILATRANLIYSTCCNTQQFRNLGQVLHLILWDAMRTKPTAIDAKIHGALNIRLEPISDGDRRLFREMAWLWYCVIEKPSISFAKPHSSETLTKLIYHERTELWIGLVCLWWMLLVIIWGAFFYTSRFHILEDRIIYNNVILLDESSDFLRNDGEIKVGVGHETTLDPLAGHIGLQEILKIGQPM